MYNFERVSEKWGWSQIWDLFSESCFLKCIQFRSKRTFKIVSIKYIYQDPYHFHYKVDLSSGIFVLKSMLFCLMLHLCVPLTKLDTSRWWSMAQFKSPQDPLLYEVLQKSEQWTHTQFYFWKDQGQTKPSITMSLVGFFLTATPLLSLTKQFLQEKSLVEWMVRLLTKWSPTHLMPKKATWYWWFLVRKRGIIYRQCMGGIDPTIKL